MRVFTQTAKAKVATSRYLGTGTSVDTVYVALGIAQDLGAQRSAEMIQFVRDEIIVSGGTPPNDWCVSLAVHVQSGLI